MKDWWKVALGLVSGLLAAGLILLVSSQPRGEPIGLTPPPTPAPIIVHVSGSVAQPGLFTLPANSRVGEAVDAAGGMLPEANPQALNLASILEDGERVFVPAQPPTPDPAKTSPGGTVVPAATEAAFPININTASQADLEKLPGIGPVTAQSIITFREGNGPFDSIETIQEVPGIGPKTFERVKDLITVDLWD